jgi:2-polyprenyl-3-methyl-5-hydroxy-6-metoxy-1,4-benzoquinol methylase
MSKFEKKISNEIYSGGNESERTSKIFMRNYLLDSKPLLILDIGCGTGLNAGILKKMGHDIKGIDVSEAGVDKFVSEGFEGKVADASESIPYEDETFDLVYASEIIEHVADTESLLREINRVLKPGGAVLLSTPNSSFWVYRLFALLGTTLSELQHVGHIRFFSVSSLTTFIENSDFSIESVGGRNMYMVFNDAIGKLLKKLPTGKLLVREFRFRTGKYFWHLSNFSEKASRFWSDTLIVKAIKR